MGSLNWKQLPRGNLKERLYIQLQKKIIFFSKRHPTSVVQNRKAVLQNRLWTTTPAWLLAMASMLTSLMIPFNRKPWLFNKVHSIWFSLHSFSITSFQDSSLCPAYLMKIVSTFTSCSLKLQKGKKMELNLWGSNIRATKKTMSNICSLTTRAPT